MAKSIASRREATIEPLHTVAEFAEMMRVTTRTVRNWIVAGDLKVIRIRRGVRLPHSEILRFIEGKT